MRTVLFLMFISFMTVGSLPETGLANEKFVVYYSDKVPTERFKPYQLVVLDSDYFPPLQPLKEDGKLLLGYLSLGEAETRNSYFNRLKQAGLLLEENKDWENSFIIDMRGQLWQSMVIEEIIPGILRKGFDGLIFDTLDSPLMLEREHPNRYKGMGEASTRLVQAIRMHFPNIKLMVNRGYDILPQIAPHIDMVLGECLLGDYDFKKKIYTKVDEPLYQKQLDFLSQGRQRNPNLKIYTLDYADKGDNRTIAELYRRQRASGFIPYVATIGLDEIIAEPEL